MILRLKKIPVAVAVVCVLTCIAVGFIVAGTGASGDGADDDVVVPPPPPLTRREEVAHVFKSPVVVSTHPKGGENVEMRTGYDAAGDMPLKEMFAKKGYVPAFKAFDADDIRMARQAWRKWEILRRPGPDRKEDARWYMSCLAYVPECRTLGLRPAVLDVVEQLLGPEFILFAIDRVHRAPDTSQMWHSGVEALNCKESQLINVWIGLNNINNDTAPYLIPYSHLVGPMANEAVKVPLLGKFSTSELLHYGDQLVRYAHLHGQPSAHLLHPTMQDGWAGVWSFRTWHATVNPTALPRDAFLLRYTTPDCPIRRPKNFEPPVITFYDQLPPVLLVRNRTAVPEPDSAFLRRHPHNNFTSFIA